MTRATAFEMSLVNEVNLMNKTKYKGKDLMEWSTSEEKVKKDAQEGETVYHCQVAGVWVAMKDKEK